MYTFKQNLLKLIPLVAFLALPQFLNAAELESVAEDKVAEISKRFQTQINGWGSSTANLKISTRNADGELNQWELRVRSLEGENGLDKDLYIVRAPLTKKDEKILVHWKKNASNVIWRYSPETKNIQRASSRERVGPFLDSEYSLEDIGLFRFENLSFVFLGEDKVGDDAFYKIEAKPNYSNSAYSKQIVWLDKENLRVQRVDYYDLAGKKLKTQRLLDYKLYNDKYWRASKTVMRNYQTKRESHFYWSELKMNQNLTAKDFKKSVLKRDL
jgi:hypothetical protein